MRDPALQRHEDFLALRNKIPDDRLAEIEAATIAKAAGLLAQEPATKGDYDDALVRLIALALTIEEHKVKL